MLRCIELARQGAGSAAPNPMVGCVIACDGRIIGEGWHRRCGDAHAEVNAIRSVTDVSRLTRSTLYVSLEPCSHHGRTPPCADLILKHGIPEVVIAMRDPNPEVNGAGIDRMISSGVRVRTGILETKARSLNRAFITGLEKKRPYVHLKWAVSSDGLIAPADGKAWLSNRYLKRLTHRWRKEYDAIMVGSRTVLTDDPRLTDRYWGGPHPLRVVIDPELMLDPSLSLLSDGRQTLVFNLQKDQEMGSVHKVDLPPGEEGDIPVDSMLEALYHRDVHSVLVEGGAETLTGFLRSGLWDKATVLEARRHLGQGLAAPVLPAEPIQRIRIGDNHIAVYGNS